MARTGDLFIFSEVFLWSLFPVFTIISNKTLQPLYTAALSTFLAGLFFAVILTVQGKWHELLNRKAWKYILITTLFIGIIIYSLLFVSLKYTTAGNASLLYLLEIFFSFLILGMMGREKVTLLRVSGAVLMVLGASFVILPGISGLNYGDILILVALLFAPIGNLAQQSARKHVSSPAIMFVRSILSSAVLFAMAVFFSPLPSTADLKASLLFLAVNGTLFMGLSKLLWIEGIHRIPITRANAISTFAPFLTLTAAFLMLGDVPNSGQLIGIIPMIAGALLVLRKEEEAGLI
ncbi:MAG: DMT family transporter [Nanoarchaeota archaeon]|nr:DMT family transporter [Nanoarchaeota archaeon]